MANGVQTIDTAAPQVRPREDWRRTALIRFARKKPLGVAGALLMGALIATAFAGCPRGAQSGPVQHEVDAGREALPFRDFDGELLATGRGE